MLILVSYYRGEMDVYKYLENFEELEKFLQYFVEIYFDDVERLKLTFFRGKEEQIARQRIKDKKEKKDVKN